MGRLPAWQAQAHRSLSLTTDGGKADRGWVHLGFTAAGAREHPSAPGSFTKMRTAHRAWHSSPGRVATWRLPPVYPEPSPQQATGK